MKPNLNRRFHLASMKSDISFLIVTLMLIYLDENVKKELHLNKKTHFVSGLHEMVINASLRRTVKTQNTVGWLNIVEKR